MCNVWRRVSRQEIFQIVRIFKLKKRSPFNPQLFVHSQFKQHPEGTQSPALIP